MTARFGVVVFFFLLLLDVGGCLLLHEKSCCFLLLLLHSQDFYLRQKIYLCPSPPKKNSLKLTASSPLKIGEPIAPQKTTKKFNLPTIHPFFSREKTCCSFQGISGSPIQTLSSPSSKTIRRSCWAAKSGVSKYSASRAPQIPLEPASWWRYYCSTWTLHGVPNGRKKRCKSKQSLRVFAHQPLEGAGRFLLVEKTGKYLNQVIQFMTFLSPNVGGHDSPSKGSLKSPAELPGKVLFGCVNFNI